MWSNIVKEALQDDEEREPDTSNKFSCYYAGSCKRQIYLSKLRLKDLPVHALGSMQIGTLVHKWLENEVEYPDNYEPEKKFKFIEDGIKISGRADVVTPDEVVDFKTINGFNYVNKSAERNKPQINLYMHGFNKTKGRLVYIDKGKMFVREITHDYNEELLEETISKYKKVLNAIKNTSLPVTSPEDIPFDKCGENCYLCKNEQLNIGD